MCVQYIHVYTYVCCNWCVCVCADVSMYVYVCVSVHCVVVYVYVCALVDVGVVMGVATYIAHDCDTPVTYIRRYTKSP